MLWHLLWQLLRGLGQPVNHVQVAHVAQIQLELCPATQQLVGERHDLGIGCSKKEGSQNQFHEFVRFHHLYIRATTPFSSLFRKLIL